MKNILLGAATAVALLSLCGAADAAPTFAFSLNGGNVVSVTGTSLNDAAFTFTSGGATYSIADINAQYNTITNSTGSTTTINFTGSSITRTAGTGTSTLIVALTLTDLPEKYLPKYTNVISGNDANNGVVAYSTTTTALYRDAGDATFATTTGETSASPADSAPLFTWSVSNSNPGTSLANPYSVTLLRTLTFTNNNGNAANFSGISVITSVPEPASLALLGTGLLAAGFMFARRRKNNAADA